MSISLNREEILSFVKKSCFYYDLPGLAVSAGVLSDTGRPDVCRAVAGFQDLAAGKSLREDHIFHMASVTKLFVGTSVLQLWEKGLLDLDDKLAAHLPDFTMADPRYAYITLRQILSHTAGLPDVTDYHWDSPETDETALQRYVSSPEVSRAHLLWAPGQGGFAYSNIGYEILGCVISAVSGLSFEDYVAEHILRPLGMDDSTLLGFRRTDDAAWAAPHAKDENNHIIPLHFRYNFPYNRAHGPSSTLTSNLADMEKWAAACLDLSPALLSPSSWELARTPVALVPNNGEQLCLSWFRRKQSGHILYGHEGTDDGFRASFWLCPQLRLWLIVCSNLSAAPVKKINKELFKLLCE